MRYQNDIHERRLKVFGNRLCDAMAKKGITPLELAGHMHMPVKGVQQMLSGDYTPSLWEMFKIAQHVNRKIDWLLATEIEFTDLRKELGDA